ncbi:MAG: zinc ABC transporter substrate-binding protein [Candidatus Bathyarchaeota archaeon]|nr:zinc ABC transporter substrate-binding protein [Candidatus Bathyarchaeota archaeon]
MNDRQKIFILSLTSALVLSGFLLIRNQQTETSTKKIKLVASFYPISYFAEMIGGERVEVKTLIKPGVEVHSWQPSANDIIAASEADIIAYNGAGLDLWVEENILPVINTSQKTIVDTTKNAEIYVNLDQKEISEHGRYDPHTWLSPILAVQQAESIYKALLAQDPKGSAYYTSRWNQLKETLQKIDTDYVNELTNRKRDLVFVTHDAFGYLARHYGFKQYSIVGLTADKEPSTEDLANLIETMKTKDTYVFYLEPGYSDAYVQTIRTELESQTGKTVRILKLYHMNGPVDGLDYLQQMKTNLINLKAGLVE